VTAVRIGESLRFAIRGILANRMRSALTMLGLLIGVASVITLMAVGTGSSRAVHASIDRLGSSTLLVQPFQAGGGGFGTGVGSTIRRKLGLPPAGSRGTQSRIPSLSPDDLDALSNPQTAPHIEAVAPIIRIDKPVIALGAIGHDETDFLLGVSPNYLDIDNTGVVIGAPFTEEDYRDRRRLALLGESVALHIATATVADLVGRDLLINGAAFTVAGVLEAKGSSGQINLDNRILAVGTAVSDTLYGYNPNGTGALTGIVVKATAPGDVPRAQEELIRALSASHGVDLIDADFTVFDATATLKTSAASTKTFGILLTAVAAISLLVGGIGVMNIQLVSVTERTREIGIRKAVGATRRDIVGQFLGEAVFLSVLGGILGVLVGALAARFTIAGVDPAVAPFSVYLALGVSVGTGLVFGLYPASRAADLRPIDALRYE